MINFLHNFLPQPILFQFGFITIYWYGLFVVSGILAGMFLTLKLARRAKISADQVYDLGFYLIIFSLLGARIYAVLLELPYYLENPFEIIAVWHGGLAIHGSIIGALITLIIYCYKKRLSFWQWADLLAVVLPLGQAIGRWGNYFNQELFGRPTSLPWGIPIELKNRPEQFLNYQYFHPTFLYESVLNLLNFFFLYLLYCYLTPPHPRPLPQGGEGVFSPSPPPSPTRGEGDEYSFPLSGLSGERSNKEFPRPAEVPTCRDEGGERERVRGVIFLIYLINYSLIRIMMEFFRIDSTPLIFGVRLPILVSAGVISISLIVIILRFVRQKPPSNLTPQ